MAWWNSPSSPKSPPPNQPPGAPIKTPSPKKSLPPKRGK